MGIGRAERSRAERADLELGDEIDRLKETICEGVQDRDVYLLACGELKGLRMARNVLRHHFGATENEDDE